MSLDLVFSPALEMVDDVLKTALLSARGKPIRMVLKRDEQIQFSLA